MCIAVPMEVIEINNQNNTAKVSFSGNLLHVNISLIFPKKGDYVLVHAGCAMEIIKKEAADEIVEILDTLKEFSNEDLNR